MVRSAPVGSGETDPARPERRSHHWLGRGAALSHPGWIPRSATRRGDRYVPDVNASLRWLLTVTVGGSVVSRQAPPPPTCRYRAWIWSPDPAACYGGGRSTIL